MNERILGPSLMFLSAIIVAGVFFSVVQNNQPSKWTQTATDVAVARALLRDCTKEFHGIATVETKWEGDIPVSWTIECEFETP